MTRSINEKLPFFAVLFDLPVSVVEAVIPTVADLSHVRGEH